MELSVDLSATTASDAALETNIRRTNMKIKKTVGFISGEGSRKGYDIHTDCGEVFRATPLGSQRYQCNGLSYKSLRAVKDSIIKGALAETDDDEVAADETSTSDGADTWDCVHPCALLISLLPFGVRIVFRDQITETLGNYGWLDCMGRPDIARAEREIARVKKLSWRKVRKF
jgi:hypothetical protein